MKHGTSTAILMYFENLIPSDHAGPRRQSKNRQFGATRTNAFRVGCPNIPFFCSIVKHITDDHQYPDDPFVALADCKVVLEKAGKLTVHELLRKAPGSPGAKLLAASTALRTYRNRHLGTLMHCCEAWEICRDRCSFKCIDFHGLSQIVASLTRQRESQNESQKYSHISKKTVLWLSADLVFAPGAPRNQYSASTLLPMKTATLWKTKTNRAGQEAMRILEYDFQGARRRREAPSP